MARRFRAARERAELSLESVAEAAGTSPRTIRVWESGITDPVVPAWLRAVEALRANPDQIARGGARLPWAPDTPADVDALPQRLRLVRERRGVGQRELARRIEITHASVMRWEAGTREPRLLALLKALDVLETSLEVLVGRAPLPDLSPAVMERFGIEVPRTRRRT